MRFDIMTLFPEAVDAMMQSSILGRAQKKGLIEIHTHQIRDYTTNKQNQARRGDAVRPALPLLGGDL